MSGFWRPNLEVRGRAFRWAMAVLLGLGAWLAWGWSGWVSGVLGLAGLFTAFEAGRGWCVLRACGIRTRL